MFIRRQIIKKLLDQLEDPRDLADLLTMVEAQAASRRRHWFAFFQEMTVFVMFTGLGAFYGYLQAWWPGAGVMGALAATLSIASYKRWEALKPGSEEGRRQMLE